MKKLTCLFFVLPIFVGSMLTIGLRASEDKKAAASMATMAQKFLMSSAMALEREKELKEIFDEQAVFPEVLRLLIFSYLKSSFYHARTIQASGYRCCSIGNNQFVCANEVTRSADGWNSSMEIWDIESGKSVAMLKGHADGITSLLFLPGKNLNFPHNDWLASGSEHGVIRIWDLKTQACLKELGDGGEYIGDMALNGNNLLVAPSLFSERCVWDLAKGICLQKFKMGSPACDLSPEKLLIRSPSDLNKIEIWETDDLLNLKRPKEALQIKGGKRLVSIVVSPLGKIAMKFEGVSQVVEIWDSKNKKRKYSFPCRTDAFIRSIAWLQDQNEVCAILAKTIGGGDLFLHDGETGECLDARSFALGPVDI